MNRKHLSLKTNKIGLALVIASFVTLTGCVGYVDGPRVGVGVEAPVFVAQDDYVYYPDYECYYSVNLHQYAYREGNAWVARPAPRGVSVDVLMRSPSVRMDFHDSPANHHADVVRQYPGNRAHPGAKQSRGNQKDGRGENNGR
jgi:hypothetical protein